jgi:hypothetical protein
MKMPSSWVLSAATFTAGLLVACGSPAPQAGPVASPVNASAAAPDDGLAKLTDEELVHQLLVVTGAGDIGNQIAQGMMESFRKMPNLPSGFADRFKQNTRTETLVALLVPIYLKHYDRDTMIAAIRFYQSEPGRKFVKALPAATAESMDVGKKWGGDLAKKTLQDLGATAP